MNAVEIMNDEYGIALAIIILAIVFTFLIFSYNNNNASDEEVIIDSLTCEEMKEFMKYADRGVTFNKNYIDKCINVENEIEVKSDRR